MFSKPYRSSSFLYQQPQESKLKQKGEILQNFLNSLPKPLDFFTLIDGSGSVSDDQFTIMKFCMRTLAAMFDFPTPPDPLGVRIGAVQFDDQAYIVCDLTADRTAYTTAIVSMPQKKGGTNAGQGLLTCLNLFVKADVRNATRAIILFTDGDVNAAKTVHKQLLTNGIRVFSVGIGLAELYSAVLEISENAIFVSNFEEMQVIVSQLSVQPSAPPKINTRTKSTKKASFDIIYSEPFSLVELKIIEDGSNIWKTLPTAENNVFFVENLTQDKEYHVTARVQTRTNAWTPESKRETFRTLRENPETATLKSPKLPEINDRIIKYLNEFSIPAEWQALTIPHLNIALLGNIGHGKSAYFNSIYSTLLGYYAEVQLHKISTKTVTLTINKKFLTNKAIRLWDTYGWTSANSSYEREFEFLLEGAIADGYKEGEEILNKLNATPQIGDKVHAIVVVYEMPSVMTETNMNALRRFYNKMCDKNLQPIVILTKVDLIREADLEGRLSDVFDSGVIDVYIAEFCRNSTIPRANVFPLVNFRGSWAQRDYVAEKLILNAFNTAVTFGRSKIANLLEKKVVVYDSSRRIAIVNIISVDDNISFLMNQITQEPGLEQFQPYLRGSTTVIQKAQYLATKFISCASSSTHGYWEVFGLLPSSPNSITPTSTPTSTANAKDSSTAASLSQIDANKNIEIAVFATDPYTTSKSIGSVFIAPKSTLADLRDLISDELEIPAELQQFQFVRLGGPNTGSKLPLVGEHDEHTVKISDVMVIAKNPCVRIAKAQALEIGILLEQTKKKVGFIENVSLQTPLDRTKIQIAEQTEIDYDFRFLTLTGNNVSPVQEKSRPLQSIIRDGEDGEQFFVIRKVQPN